MSVYQRINREHRARRQAPTLKDKPPAISAYINIEGRIKSIAADTPDDLMHKFSRVLAKEGIDVWAILTKPRKQ